MNWTLHNQTSPRKRTGYMRICCDGKRIADVFPYAPNSDADEVIEQAMRIVKTMNGKDGDEK